MNKFWLFILTFLISATAAHVALRPSEVFLKSDCNIGKDECTLSKGDKNFTLSLTPRPIVPNTKTVFKVKTQKDATKVRLYLFGHDLNTERTYLDLHNDGEGYFSLTDLFPTCVEDSQKWKAHIQVYTPNTIMKANLWFEVSREKK